MVNFICVALALALPYISVASSLDESCSDDSLLLQKSLAQDLLPSEENQADAVLGSLGIGASKRAMTLLQMTMASLPTKDPSSASMSAMDVGQILRQSEVLNGDDSTHLKDIDKTELEKAKDIIRGMLRNNLKALHDEDQVEVKADYDELVACGTTMTEALGSPAAAQLATITTYRAAHTKCRVSESNLNKVNASTWTTYKALEQSIASSSVTCPSIPTTLASMTTFFDEADNPYLKWITESKVLFTDKKREYVEADQAAAAKRKVCNTDQGAFEDEFCSYRDYLHSTCSTLDSCHQRTLAKYRATKDGVRGAESQRKDFFKSSEAIICHLDVILGVGSGNHADCASAVSSVSTAELDVTYPDEVTKTACDISTADTAPDSGDWSTREYSVSDGFPSGVHLADVRACSTSSPATAAPVTEALTVEYETESGVACDNVKNKRKWEGNVKDVVECRSKCTADRGCAAFEFFQHSTGPYCAIEESCNGRMDNPHNGFMTYVKVAAIAEATASEESILGESILLSTDVALPEGESTHLFSTGGSLPGQGVDFVKQCGNSNADPYMVQYNSQGDTVDLAAFITAGDVGGSLGVDTHGRGLLMGFEGESGGSGKGFGCHANWLITFDLQTIRTKYFAGRPGNYRFTGRFGITSNSANPSQLGQGVILCDGVVSAASDKLKRSDGGQDVTAQVPSSARYLTIAMLNGDESTINDDQVWLDPTLHEVVG